MPRANRHAMERRETAEKEGELDAIRGSQHMMLRNSNTLDSAQRCFSTHCLQITAAHWNPDAEALLCSDIETLQDPTWGQDYPCNKTYVGYIEPYVALLSLRGSNAPPMQHKHENRSQLFYTRRSLCTHRTSDRFLAAFASAAIPLSGGASGSLSNQSRTVKLVPGAEVEMRGSTTSRFLKCRRQSVGESSWC